MPIRPAESDTGTEVYRRIDLLKLRLVLTNGIGTVNDCFVGGSRHCHRDAQTSAMRPKLPLQMAHAFHAQPFLQVGDLSQNRRL